MSRPRLLEPAVGRLNEPNLNGDAKLFFFLGVDASAAVAVVVVVAVLSRRLHPVAICFAKCNGMFLFLPWAPREGASRQSLGYVWRLREKALLPPKLVSAA